MKNLFVCTDLDRTLLPNGKQPESPKAISIFTYFVNRPEVYLAYVSGRNLALVQDAIREYHLPLPNWVIGDVGSTIYEVNGDDWQQLQRWEQEIAIDWNRLTANDLQPLFVDIADLTLQESEKQNHYKLSYYLPLNADTQTLQEAIKTRLEQQNVAASLIYSVDEAAAVGLLDIVPAHATKLHAIEFLMRQQGFDYENTVFAGDSGNDLPVLVSGISSVLVANAHDEVIAKAQLQSQQQGTMKRFYLARGDFLGMNGNYSAGILEGIVNYHPDLRPYLECSDES